MTTRRQWHAKGLRRPPPGPRRLSWWMAERLHVSPLGVTGEELMEAIACLKSRDGDVIQSHWLQMRHREAGKTHTHMSRRDFTHFGGKGVGGGSSGVCGAIRGDRPDYGPASFFATSTPPTCAECAKRWDEAMRAREVIIQKQIAEIRKRFPNWTPRGGLGEETRSVLRDEIKRLP